MKIEHIYQALIVGLILLLAVVIYLSGFESQKLTKYHEDQKRILEHERDSIIRLKEETIIEYGKLKTVIDTLMRQRDEDDYIDTLSTDELYELFTDL
jgi:hypothetical protein